jgi:hypothetical protein
MCHLLAGYGLRPAAKCVASGEGGGLLLNFLRGEVFAVCRLPWPLAPDNAEGAPAKPALLTPVAGRLPVAVPVAGRLLVAAPVASRDCWDIKAVGYCPTFSQVDGHFIAVRVTSNLRP